MSVKTNEMIENFETENLMDNPDYRAFYKRHMKKLERQRPLCRVTESIKPAIEWGRDEENDNHNRNR
jgi:hypothetical protein